MSSYELCRGELANLINTKDATPGQRNEATTRLHLIDRILFDCLGWSRDDAILEESQGQEYADYTLLLGPSRKRVLIVEAKKEGNYFELPAGNNRIEYSLPVLMRDYPNLKSALEQAAGYCQSRGVPFGAVSNGRQIVAFVATRNDGQPPLEGKALVFPSLFSMLEHFLDLWQALSRPGVEGDHLRLRLAGGITPDLPPKLSTSIWGYPGSKNRNPFQADLQNLSDLIIEDFTRSPELETVFLEECYCKSGALSQYSLEGRL